MASGHRVFVCVLVVCLSAVRFNLSYYIVSLFFYLKNNTNIFHLYFLKVNMEHVQKQRNECVAGLRLPLISKVNIP